jgi:hypothetical protein
MGALLAQTPALPLHTAGKYVAGAYVVLFALVLVYVAIMATRLSHVERDLAELRRQAQGDGQVAPGHGEALAELPGEPESTPV